MVDFPFAPLLVSALLLLIGLLFCHRRHPAHEPRAAIALYSRETRAATSLYERAWGKRWPRHTGTIHISELGRLCDGDELYLDQGGNDTLVYDCLEGVDKVMAALSMPKVADVMVVLKEYDPIRRILERDRKRAFVVTGHPGIGLSFKFLILAFTDLASRQIHLFDIPSPPSPRVETPHSISTLK